MLKRMFIGVVSMAMLCAGNLWCADHGQLVPFQKFRLPVSTTRGYWRPVTDAARKQFAMRVAPDESILVFDSDTSGNWPLVRIEKWWTEKPISEVIQVPAFSSADTKHIDRVFVDLQVTPDGHYAVAFAGAKWMDKSEFIFHAPRGYMMRQPDTIITVIDLDQWRIVKTGHTAPLASGEVVGLRIVNDRWVALDFDQGESSPLSLLYRHIDQLLSVPDLEHGPVCTSLREFRRSPHLSGSPREPKSENDAACHDVLQATRMNSLDELETLIYRGQEIDPGPLVQRSEGLVRDEDDYFRHWGEYRDYLLTGENPPLESPSRHWYGLYPSQERGFYDLEQLDLTSKGEHHETIRNLLCGDPALEQRGSYCGCRVIDASETTGNLLAYCRTQRGSFDGAVRREWLGVLRTSDSTGVGYIDLSKNETTEGIAAAENRGYIVTCEFGETVRVYAIPDTLRR